MYPNRDSDADDTLASLNEAIEEFHRIKDYAQRASSGSWPSENVDRQAAAEQSLVSALD